MVHRLECPDCEKPCPLVKEDKYNTEWFDCKKCEHYFGIAIDGDILYKQY